MTDELTPAQARRALKDLLDRYEPQKIWGVVTGQGIDNKLSGVEDRNTLEQITRQLDQAEIRRKTVGDDADPRGIEETPQGMAEMQAEGLTISWPVEFAVEVVGQPGRREIELSSQNRLVDDLDDVMEALAANYPHERDMDDPRQAFIEDAAATVASHLGSDLDSMDMTGRVGTLRLRSDGRWTFHRDDDGGEMPDGAITPETVDDEMVGRSDFQRGSGGRRPGDTQPTTTRPEPGQQTLSEAGTVEGLDQFAEGTVSDDPDRVIGPADEVVREQRSATTGGERTQPRSEGLGRFEQFAATIRAHTQADPDKENALGETIPGTKVVNPWIVSPDGQSPAFDLRSDLETAIHRAADVEAMHDEHGAGETLTIGTAHFTDGGDTLDRVEFNDNWIGDTNVRP